MMTEDRLLTPEEVGERLQLSTFTVMHYLRKGRLRGVKLTKHWRVKASDLQAFIDAHVQNGVEPTPTAKDEIP